MKDLKMQIIKITKLKITDSLDNEMEIGLFEGRVWLIIDGKNVFCFENNKEIKDLKTVINELLSNGGN